MQFTLRFKGREMAHQDLGYALFRRVKTDLWQVSKIERDAKMEGRRMTLVLQPDHKPAGAKPPVPGAAPAPKAPMTAGTGLNIPKPPGAAVGAPPAAAAPRPAGIPPAGPPAAAAAPRPAAAPASPAPRAAPAPARPGPAPAAVEPAAR